jgi:type IV pilus assembly protein PilX
MNALGKKSARIERILNSPLRRERGASLMLSLILIIALSVLGIAAMQNSSIQERMANNMRDRNVALQAAELALRDAERDLAGKLADNSTLCLSGSTASMSGGTSVTCRAAGKRPDSADSSKRSGFWSWSPALRQTWLSGCTDGQCLPVDNTSGTVPVWDDTAANWQPQTGSTGTNPTTAYGTYTGATAIANVAAQPRYIMEVFPPGSANSPDVFGTGGTQRVAIRITVRAVGQNPNTVVVLQSIVSPHI